VREINQREASVKQISVELLRKFERTLEECADTMGLVVTNGEAFLFRATLLYDFGSPSRTGTLQSLALGAKPIAASLANEDEVISLSMIRSIQTHQPGILEVSYFSAHGAGTLKLRASESTLLEMIRAMRQSGACVNLGMKQLAA
jgi:hypothetical protein